MALPIRNSGRMDINAGDSERWPSGRPGSPTGSPGNLTWVAEPGKWGSGMAVGGGAPEFTGYGYGSLGPNGPDRNNLPMPWPPNGLNTWWATDTGFGAWPPALTRCSTIITGGVMGTPWVVRRNNDPREVPTPQWLINPMGANRVDGIGGPLFGVARRRTAGEFFSTILFNALNWGRGAWCYQVAADGQPLAGSCLLIDPFSIERVEGTDVWQFNPGSDEPTITDDQGYFSMGGTRWRLVIMRGLPPYDELSSDWFGGVIPRHFAAINEIRRVHHYVSAMFDSPKPSGVLKVSTPAGFTPEEAERLKSSWTEAHGRGRAGGVAVLNSTVDYQEVTKGKMLDMDLPSVHTASLMSIAHAYTLSSVWLDVSADSITYTNRIDARTDLVDQTLRPFGSSFEQMMDSILPAGQRLEVKWSKFIQPSQLELAQGWLPILNAQAITLEEYRAKIDMPPIVGEAIDENQRR